MSELPTWLLLGASGRVGGALARFWRETPPAARIVTQSRTPGCEIIWDPTDPASFPVAKLPQGRAPSVIISGLGAVPGRTRDLNDNARLARATLDLAASLGTSRVLLCSSAAVYSPDAPAPWRETATPTDPTSAYGRAKLRMEAAMRAWDHGEACALRIGNLWGADALLGRLGGEGGRPSPVQIDRFADGAGPRRSYIGAPSLARAIAALAATPKPLPAVLNVAGRVLPMSDLADASGLPWTWAQPDGTAIQDATLDVSQLAAFIDPRHTESSAIELARDAYYFGS